MILSDDSTIIFTVKFAENGTTTFLDNRLLQLIKKYGLQRFQVLEHCVRKKREFSLLL